MPAIRAGTFDITIGQKLVELFVIVLLLLAYLKLVSLLVELQEKLLRGFVVQLSTGPVVVVERNPQLLKGTLVEVVVFVDNLLWRNTFLFCPDSYGCSVLIATTNPYHITAHSAQVAYVDVGRQIRASQVS